MVPPVNGNGAVYSGVTGDALSRPTQMPSPTRQKAPGWVTISPSPTCFVVEVERQRAGEAGHRRVGALPVRRELGGEDVRAGT